MRCAGTAFGFGTDGSGRFEPAAGVATPGALSCVTALTARLEPAQAKEETARRAYLESPRKPDGLYIPCGGWGSIHNIPLLERDLDTTVITWLNGMVWAPMRRLHVAETMQGFGRLLATSAESPPSHKPASDKKGKAR